MAAPNVGELFENIAAQLMGLTSAINAQGVVQSIVPFEGTPQNLRIGLGQLKDMLP